LLLSRGSLFFAFSSFVGADRRTDPSANRRALSGVSSDSPTDGPDRCALCSSGDSSTFVGEGRPGGCSAELFGDSFTILSGFY